jgi:hypothetical protein
MMGDLMGKFLRPKAEVLPDNAIVPEKNLISPAPNQFTHELTRPEPYYYSSAQRRPPDGEFPAGTRVVLVHRGDRCRVVDGRGIYAEIDCGGLKKL